MSSNKATDTPPETAVSGIWQDQHDTKYTYGKPDQIPRNPPFRSEWAVECNMMSFVDGNGVKHKIHLPKGTMKRACQLFAEENWDELVKFPVYNGQQYTEDDWYRVEGDPSDDPSQAKL